MAGEDEKDVSIGRQVFDVMRTIRTITDGAPPQSTRQDDASLKPDTATMQDIMPLTQWEKMGRSERHIWLDRFYAYREKALLEQYGKEECAREELDHYQCERQGFRWMDLVTNQSQRPLVDRMYPCFKLKDDWMKCVERETLTAKVKRVFGEKEAEPYLEILVAQDFPHIHD